MITRDNIVSIITQEFGFTEESNVFVKHFGTDSEGFDLAYNAGTGEFLYPEGVEADRNTTMDQHQQESFVVFLCVAQLFERGYLPKHLKLEGKNYAGTDKGYCDILVKNNDGTEYLIIECKTAELSKKDDEFRKHWAKTLRNGDQLFRYFNTYRKAKYLCLYAADYPEYTRGSGKAHKFENIYHVISLIDNEQRLAEDKRLKSFEELRRDQGGSDEFFNVWKNTYLQDSNDRGLLEEGVAPFEIGQKVYSIADLKTVDEYSLEKKYHEFALILRKHTISSHENAFDKLINLFLSKIIDEKYNANELTLLWKGTATDNYFSLQDRLNILYRQGMKEFFKDEVTYVENRQIDDAFSFLSSKADEGRDTIKKYFRQLKYFNNNPFAFLDVHNEELFYKNAIILKDVISMLQDIYLTSNNDNQFLGDLFEGFLNKGVHQSEGQFFSPIPIVRFLVSSLPLRQIIEGNISIPKAIDYACGSGHFLTEYARQIKPIVEAVKNTDVKNYYEQIVGIEKDYRLSKVSQVAAFMYGMDGIKIHYSDALVDVPDVKDHTFSFLVANPPYSVSGFLETLTEEERDRYTLSSYVSNIEKNNSIETFFIERSAQLLKTGGVATIILPSSILSKSGLYMRTRELMLKYFDFVSICCFGQNTFGQTNTSTVALFLRRKSIETEPCEHYKNRINAWFSGNMEDDDAYNDSDKLESYVQLIGVSLDDYIAMLSGNLTDTYLDSEIVREYVKTLNIKKTTKNSNAAALSAEAKKVRDEAQSFVKSRAYKDKTTEGQVADELMYTLRFIQAIEKEKLYYYLLATDNPQPVLVVQAPSDKTKEKKFLGYEWSNRKGDEGIHYLNTVVSKETAGDDEDADDNTLDQIKGINGIQTPLFNPDLSIDDHTKINHFIRNNFSGEDFTVPEELEEIVHSYNLTDMLDFGKATFDKTVNTSVAFKMQFESKYELVPFKKYVDLNPAKSEVTGIDDSSMVSFIEMSSVSENGYIETMVDKPYGEVKKGSYTYFAENDIIIAKITPCMENGKCGIASGLTNKVAFGSSEFHVMRCHGDILNTYLLALLNTEAVRYCAQKNMTGSSGHRRVPESFYKSLEIPLPPKDIQIKIAQECAKADKLFAKNLSIIETASREIAEIVSSLNGKRVKVSKVCDINKETTDPTSNPSQKYKYVDIEAVENGTGCISYDKVIDGKDAPSRARRIACAGSTIISTVRPNLKGFAFVDTDVVDAVYSTGFAVLKSKDTSILSDKMIYYQFMYSSAMMEQMTASMPKGSYPSINRDNIENFSILAEIEDETIILAKLDECEGRIKDARKIVANHDVNKQSILDKYLK